MTSRLPSTRILITNSDSKSSDATASPSNTISQTAPQSSNETSRSRKNGRHISPGQREASYSNDQTLIGVANRPHPTGAKSNRWVGRFGTAAWPEGDGPLVVDLCSGCGGLSLGFAAAGFRVAVAVEIDSAAVEAHQRNFPDVKVLGPYIAGDITKVKASDILSTARVEQGEIGLVIGGVPCQGFSVAGNQDPADKRNLLYLDYVRLVRDLQPKAFLFENVPNMKNFNGGVVFNDLRARLGEANYHDDFAIINAAKYGVPQLRTRLFIAGTRTSELPPTLSDGWLSKDEFIVLQEAFDGLATNLDTIPVEGPYELPYEEITTPYAQLLRNPDSKVITVSNCIPTQHSDKIANRIGSLKAGQVDEVSYYRRLDWRLPAWTLRAGTRTDTACRPVHPSAPRVITIREAARISSFPDEFWFPDKKSTAHMLIGNSVPPLLAYHLAMQIASQVFDRTA